MIKEQLSLYGLDTTENFKKKLNIFLTGDPNINIFQNVDWDRLVLCGSCIPACSE